MRMRITFRANAPFDEMCERAARDLNTYRRAIEPSKELAWNAWAGAHLRAMMNSPDVTAQHLTHGDSEFRLAAASLVAEYWPSHESFAAPCLRLAFHDHDPAVRGAALVSLLNKLSSFVEDTSGLFRNLMEFLRSLEPIPEEVARDVRKQFDDAFEWVHTWGLAELEELAGKCLGEMRQSASLAAAYLEHPNANLRRAALLVIHDHWKPDVDIRNICIQLITADGDLDVRVEAQGTLSALCMHTSDREVGELFARIVFDASEPIKLRKGAYVALFMVRSMPVYRVLQVASAEFRFPEDVDWEFVGTFLTTEDMGSSLDF